MDTSSISTFHAADYALFGLSLAISVGVGIFYAIKDRNKVDTEEVFLGGRKMSVIPVALSLLASFQSAISIIGIPAEVYFRNTMYLLFVLSSPLAIFCCNYIYIPIFYNLKITSAFEYLSLRFHISLRTATSVLYSIQMLLYMSVVLYAPSLALSAVTVLPLWPVVATVGVVCIFYTTIGGMKAVVWTDTFQMLVIFAGLLAVLIQGSLVTGGLANAWTIASDHGRIKFNEISGDPTVRHSIWSLIIGGTFTNMAVYGTNQAQVQRACACPTLTKARVAYWLNVPGLMISVLLYVLIGVVMFAYYVDRDPLESGRIAAPDQTVPIFVMDILGNYHGVPGLFVACLFSGALSTISSGLNAMAAVTLQDVVRPHIAPNMSQTTATWVARGLAVGLGVICLALTYVASWMGSIIQTVLSFFGAIGGPIMGVFTLGIFFPCANSYGAFAGLISSLGLSVWILIGAKVTKTPLTLPSDNSTFANLTTVSPSANTFTNPLLPLYQLSYQYYSLLSVVVCIIVGLLVSAVTCFKQRHPPGSDLIFPYRSVLNPCLPKGHRLRKKEEYQFETVSQMDDESSNVDNCTAAKNT